jgi:hypothetical protein
MFLIGLLLTHFLLCNLQGHATARFEASRYSELYAQHELAVGGSAPQMSSIEDLLAEPGSDGHAKAKAGGTSTVTTACAVPTDRLVWAFCHPA